MGLFDRLRGTAAQKVAVIGLDGVPLRFLTDGPVSCPAIDALADTGTAGTIEGITPPAVSAGWAALTTGVNPGKTGVYGFQDREVGSYDTYVPTGGDVQAPRVWDYVEDAGSAATVLNVPVTFPPQRTVSRMVAGTFAGELSQAVHPQSMVAELEQVGYRLDVDPALAQAQQYEAFLDDVTETLTARMEAFRRYLDRNDWQLFFGVFTTPDPVNHFFYEEFLSGGEYTPEVRALYRRLDSYIGELRERLDEQTTLIVVSDHGFRPLRYEVDLNQWLQSRGELVFDAASPDGLTDIAAETRAYALDAGRLYINRAGREPRGSVTDPQAAEDALIDALDSLTGPDGRSVVEDVHRGPALYDGPHTDIAPDLVVSPGAGFDLTASVERDAAVFSTSPRSGMHSRTGATALLDTPAATIDADATVLDIAPTVLDAMGVEYDRGAFDGTSLL